MKSEFEKQKQISLENQSLLNDLTESEEEMLKAMHFDFDIVEPPLELKDEVLNFVFEEEQRKITPLKKIKTLFEWVRNEFTPLTSGISIAMLLCIFLLAAPLIQGTSEEFSEIAASMKLNVAEGEQGEVYGYAFLINKSGKEELIVNVFDFPQTKGKEVYQVWLIDDGHRRSAGVFKPDKEGFGVLTVDMAKFTSFDTIGITLEPDADGKQPRGVKIVGT